MSGPAKYFIVEAAAMPEIFRKVAEAKRLLETGEEKTVNGAAQAVEISRSAFYKYKDAVRPFNDMLHGRIVTFQVLLKDEPGVLSGALNVLAGTGVNILTINQSIPANGCAVVTMTAETSAIQDSLEEVLASLSAGTGVIKCEILAGEGRKALFLRRTSCSVEQYFRIRRKKNGKCSDFRLWNGGLRRGGGAHH